MHASARVHGTQDTGDGQVHGAYVLSVPRRQDCDCVVDARRTGGGRVGWEGAVNARFVTSSSHAAVRSELSSRVGLYQCLELVYLR